MNITKNKKLILDSLFSISLILTTSLLLYVYSSKNIKIYNLINYYFADRIFYQFLSLLIIVAHVYIILRTILDYMQMKQFIIFRIKERYYLLIVRQFLICLSIFLILHFSMDFILFQEIDHVGILLNTACEFSVIPFLASKKLSKYNFVIGIFFLILSRTFITILVLH